jgi:acyl-CoA reductase-like NAD-dependent aldehyde dehydrogenase
MNTVPHIPALRRGKPYESLDRIEVKDHRTGEVKSTVSQVNAGIVRKDLQRLAESRAVLRKFTIAQLIEICARAGELFLNASLPLSLQQDQHRATNLPLPLRGGEGRGEGAAQTQSPQDYIETLSATSGLPHVMVRRNMAKIHDALIHMEAILKGLTRGLDLTVLDRGFGEQSGVPLCYYPTTIALGVVMPSNSPAVNSLWLPAIPLKFPVIIKPGREEPWTPHRLIQAFVAAGCPAEAFGFYPTDHEGAAAILANCGRALLFGDKSTTEQYANNPAIEVHGPGYSKILIGDDEIERWPEFVDLMVASIAENGGRSCINASAIVVPKYATEIAEALAKKLGPVSPAKSEDENAKLSGFANPKMAESIDATIEESLRTSGATDLTAKHRNGPRKVLFEGGVYLRPTIVRCDSFAHPLSNREFLFPYASVIQVPQPDMLNQIGPSLAVTAITKNPAFQQELLASPLIQRLNLGPIPTMRISWDQPHEGNMFEFLYHRRAIEVA